MTRLPGHHVPSKEGGDYQEAKLQLAVFYVGEYLYGVDIMRIRRVLPASRKAVREVPMTPEAIRGVIRLGTRVVPVLDLRVRFGVKIDQRYERLNKLVLVTVRGHVIALKVDRVSGELRVPADSLRPAPKLLFGAEALAPEFFSGVCRNTNDEVVFVLNLEQVLLGRGETGRQAS